MTKNLLFLIFISVIAISSCKKKKIESVNTNNSKDSLTYQPSVPGSKWTYVMTVAGVSNTTYNTTRLTYDTTINSKVYHVFNSETEGQQYIRQDGDKYYSVLTAATNKTELLIIDASKNVNESWVGGVNGSDTYTYTMKEKFATYQLDGFTFKNVLKIYQERTNGSGNVTLSGDTWYAQGVGQVKTEGTISGISVDIKLITVDLK
ncbi:MAG: hypothetical protein JNJ58_00935 [Chitinophagaceae bacterium]|nr:hypothetical protein [Chitinophagaceae bacterium]